MKKTFNTRELVFGALIAASYAVLTYASALLGLAYGPIQFRLSEALCVLPLFSPAAVWGLSVGCMLANLFSSMGFFDILFGTAATLLAALCTRALRNVKLKGFPLASFLPPVIFNAVIIGAEIAVFSGAGGFAVSALSVGAGEALSVFVAGIPVYLFFSKKKII